MTKIEKQMIGVIAAFALAITMLVGFISHRIDQAGGLKTIVIDAGKEVKDIAEQIADHERKK